MNVSMKTFVNKFNNITTEIPFDVEWENGTGYFDYATKYPLPAGELGKSVDQHGRRIIMVGTPVGTIVFFERYSAKAESESLVVVVNRPMVLNTLVPEGAQSEDMFCRVTGIYCQNIGDVLRDIVTHGK